MPSLISFGQAFQQWKEDIMPYVIAQYGADDHAALSESWNDYTDSLCKEGYFNGLQYNQCPAWDDEATGLDYADTVEYIVDTFNISFTAESVIDRPDTLMEGEGMTHYKVLILYRGKEIEIYYSMGAARTKPPTLTQVLYSLIQDANSVHCEDSFEEWADNMGFDTDSRKAEKIFYACKEVESKLKEMFTKRELSELEELYSDY